MNFKDIILQTPLHSQWSSIGIKSYHGISLPLSALRSSKSCGIGEFLDLLPLISWGLEVGFRIIQLLPLNDSGEDASPYNALSSIALHPIYLSLRSLPFLEEFQELQALLDEFHFFNTTERVEYLSVLHKKDEWLKQYYSYTYGKFNHLQDYQEFLKENRWVKEYALYKTLKSLIPHNTWQEWPSFLANPSKDHLEELINLHEQQISYYTLLQYLCYKQLKEVKEYATQHGFFIKGDLPILISPDSADVWLHRHYFDLSYEVGYPPDVFNAEGQIWGFPSLCWDKIEDHGFAWWRDRLQACRHYYHLYRLDHVAGFYRLWLIPKGQKAKEGFYKPVEFTKAIDDGHRFLKTITPMSPMLPIAEDLGNIPPELSHSLYTLGIPGTKVVRWQRDWGGGGRFIDGKDYPPLSMTTLSTHDSETLQLWWQNCPEEAKAYCAQKGWEYTSFLSSPYRFEILKESHASSSLFHINLFQEYLALYPELINEDPAKERINIPGKILPANWTYRFRAPLETILNHPFLKEQLKSLFQ